MVCFERDLAQHFDILMNAVGFVACLSISRWEPVTARDRRPRFGVELDSVLSSI